MSTSYSGQLFTPTVACQDCCIEFYGYESLRKHMQSYCYRRVKLPRSATATSEAVETESSENMAATEASNECQMLTNELESNAIETDPVSEELPFINPHFLSRNSHEYDSGIIKLIAASTLKRKLPLYSEEHDAEAVRKKTICTRAEGGTPFQFNESSGFSKAKFPHPLGNSESLQHIGPFLKGGSRDAINLSLTDLATASASKMKLYSSSEENEEIAGKELKKIPSSLDSYIIQLEESLSSLYRRLHTSEIYWHMQRSDPYLATESFSGKNNLDLIRLQGLYENWIRQELLLSPVEYETNIVKEQFVGRQHEEDEIIDVVN